MELKNVRIMSYKCFFNPSDVEIEKDSTCLIGMNESGKTAFLEALYRLNPVMEGPEASFYQVRDYPRKRRTTGSLSISQLRPLEVFFELDAVEIEEIENTFGKGILPSKSIVAHRDFKNNFEIEFHFREENFVRHVISSQRLRLPASKTINTIEALVAALSSLNPRTPDMDKILNSLSDFDLKEQITGYIMNHFPKFLYFNEFSTLPSRFSISHVLNRPLAELNRNEATARALLELAEINSTEFTTADHETRKLMLEAASRFITGEVFKYWSQNQNLRLEFDVVMDKVVDVPGDPPFVDVRIWNDEQRVSLKFSQRSKGFIWFFSFLVYFYNLKDSDVVLLLDEPGLGLHAAAQRDLLTFIEDNLSHQHQVIYTTHSPFMINPNQLKRVRVVEGKNNDGSIITKDIYNGSNKTLMPLQASLGQKLYETFSLGPYTLLVERPSDILYINILSDFLREQGRTGLDENWDILPIGRIENIPSFTALLGMEKTPVILANVRAEEKQTILSLARQQLFKPENIFFITDFTNTKEAEIEDMFADEFYLDLVRSSGISVNEQADIENGRIFEQVQQHTPKRFDSLKPAMHFMKDQHTLLPKIDGLTLSRFEDMFIRINQTAPVENSVVGV
jgi:energy-coupling factor transporter ATP-binding protein EcfA2